MWRECAQLSCFYITNEGISCYVDIHSMFKSNYRMLDKDLVNVNALENGLDNRIN